MASRLKVGTFYRGRSSTEKERYECMYCDDDLAVMKSVTTRESFTISNINWCLYEEAPEQVVKYGDVSLYTHTSRWVDIRHPNIHTVKATFENEVLVKIELL